MIRYGLYIEGATVEKLIFTPGNFGRGRTHKQVVHICPYRQRNVRDAMVNHPLVDPSSHFEPHGQGASVVHSPQGTETRQRITALREGHLVEPILKIEDVQRWLPCCL